MDAYWCGSTGCNDFGGGPFENNKLLEDLLADPNMIVPLTVR